MLHGKIFLQLDLEKMRLRLAKPTAFTLYKIPSSLKSAAELRLRETASPNEV